MTHERGSYRGVFACPLFFESCLVGLRANSVQDVIYGYLTWKNYVNGIFNYGLGYKKLCWRSHDRVSYRGVFACTLFLSRVWSVLGQILDKLSYMGT